MKRQMKVRKLRSREYKTTIEMNLPLRFFWNDEECEGFEIGPVDGCSEYEHRLLRKVFRVMARNDVLAQVAGYMSVHHKEQWQAVCAEVVKEVEESEKPTEIPSVFLDAFAEIDGG